MKKWQSKTISATSNCPKKYCYFFIESGDSFAPGLYENLEEAMSKLQPIEQDGCHCEFGLCTRLDPKGDHDYYEPCEPELDRDGLPHDSFKKQ